MDSGISEFVRLTWPSVRTTQCRTLVQAADNGDERQRWRQKMEREMGEGDGREMRGRSEEDALCTCTHSDISLKEQATQR